jgi:hypothetical protein
MMDGERLARIEEGFFARAQWMLRRAGEEALGQARGAPGEQRPEDLEAKPKPDDPGIDSAQRIRPGRLVGSSLAHPATGPRSSTTPTITSTATTSMTRPARSICRAVTRPEP